MRKKLLFILGGILFFSLGFSQAPRIVVNTTTLSDNLNSGDTSVVTFTIKNTGNRDLVYNIDLEGLKKEFAKKNFADWTLPENQDLVVPGVSITRQDEQGIFNIASENSYSTGVSPENTAWAYGMTKDLDPGDYEVWRNAILSNPPAMVNNYTSMVVADRNIYYDIFWKSWTEGGNGGGFSYTRYEVPFWINVLNGSGSLAPTETDTIKLVFDARVMNNTIREATIKINSNDPANRVVNIAASLAIAGDPICEISKDELIFDDSYIGARKSLSFDIWNTGVGTLNLSGITNTNSVFTTSFTNSPLSAGRSLKVNVNFTPTSNILFEDTLTITTNAPTDPVLKVVLSGTGLNVPDISVLPASISKEVAYSASHPYGAMDTMKLVISNPGNNDLVWEASIRKNGAVPVLFEKESYADWTLAKNQDRITSKVWITRQDQEGIYNAVFEQEYANNSPKGTLWYDGPTAESYQGGHEESLRNVFGSLGNLPGNTLSMYLPDVDKYYDVSFLTWAQGGTGGGFSYSRIETVNWLLLSEYDNTLASSDADTILVLFNPQDYKASYDAEIVIQSDVPGKETIVIPVQYTVTGPPMIDTDNDNLNFGNTFVTASQTLDLQIYCGGASPLIISGITKTNSAFTLSATNYTIEQDSFRILTVTFTPTAAQEYFDTLSITSNSMTNNVLKIPMYGNGQQPPVMTVAPVTTSHNLMSGDMAAHNLIIGNTGQSNLVWNVVFGIPTSPPVTFTKKDYADPSLPANQDRVSDHVWITRASGDAIYNAATEEGYDGESPEGTEWYNGLTAQANPGDYYNDIKDAYSWSLSNLPGNTLSMHVLETNKYYDVLFHSWTSGQEGGGFSYTRREVPTWLTMDYYSGIVLPGDADTIEVLVNANMVAAGTYAGQVIVQSNAPANGEQISTVNLTVTGTPEIELAKTSINFDTAFVNYAKPAELIIRNNGSDVLNISGISGISGRFVADKNTLSIPAWDSATVVVNFTPLLAEIYKDTLSITSNDAVNPTVKLAVSGTGAGAPAIEVSPLAINVNIYADSVYNGKIIVQNTGSSNLVWSLPENTLESALLNLNAKYQQILDKIPSRYNFAYDGVPNYINDGGDDMYDGGNYLSTNLNSNLNYSDNSIIDGSAYFGPGGRYFTRHLPGLFVLVADVNNINNFIISGNNGADGSGNTDATVIEQSIQNSIFQGLLKRIYNAGDPSINQMLIIEKNPDVVQNYSINTDNTYHEVSELSNTGRIYYILYAGSNGVYINNDKASGILNEFISVLTGGFITPSYITFDKKAGTLNAGATDTVSFVIDPTALPQGNYQNNLYVTSNDPVNSLVTIPITLQYGSIIVANPLADVVRNEGFGNWSTEFGNIFDDPQDDELTYIIVSLDENVVTVSKTATTLQVTEAGVGNTTVTIRAADGDGNVAYDDFNFRVNGLLKLANPLPDVTKAQGYGTFTINLANVFVDPENDPFTITAVSGTPAVSTVSVSGQTLTVTEVGLGETEITLTADDGDGHTVTDAFNLTVKTSGAEIPSIPVALNVYPNPSEGIIYLGLNAHVQGKVILSLFDVSGQLVYHTIYSDASELGKLDLSNLESGLYILSIRTNEKEFNQKLILE